MQLEGTTKQGPPPFFMVAKEYVPIFLGSSPPRSWRCAVGVELQTLASSSPSHEPPWRFASNSKFEVRKSSSSSRFNQDHYYNRKKPNCFQTQPHEFGEKLIKSRPLQPLSWCAQGVGERGTYFVHRRQGVVKSALRQPDHAKQCGSEAPAGKLLSMSLDFCRRLCLFPPQAHAFLTASTPRMTLRSHTRTKARA